MDEIDDPLANVPIGDLIKRMRSRQLWKRDISSKKSLPTNFTIDIWIKDNQLAPGEHKVQCIVAYSHYKNFCIGKNVDSSSIVHQKTFWDYISRKKLFPRTTSGTRTYYSLNIDITPEDIREKEKAKQKRRKANALKKAQEKKETLGT